MREFITMACNKITVVTHREMEFTVSKYYQQIRSWIQTL